MQRALAQSTRRSNQRPPTTLGRVEPVIGLAERQGADRLDAAFRRAIDVSDYRTVNGILAAGTETDHLIRPAAPTAPAHLHGRERLVKPDEAAS
jgi:hypothetical protein